MRAHPEQQNGPRGSGVCSTGGDRSQPSIQQNREATSRMPHRADNHDDTFCATYTPPELERQP